MLIIHGVYHWRPRPVAFRNDYCRHCDLPRLAVLLRTLDVLHLFWVPVLPLGFWKRWRCSGCGERPHRHTRTRRSFKIAGALVLLPMVIGSWALRPPDEADLPLVWGLRLTTAALLLFTLRAIARHVPEPELAALLLAVTPYQGWSCPLCGGRLAGAPEVRCERCGARRAAVEEARP